MRYELGETPVQRRNVSDEALKAVAPPAGVICVNLIGGFLGESLLRVYEANWN